jgi:hypothetical protein
MLGISQSSSVGCSEGTVEVGLGYMLRPLLGLQGCVAQSTKNSVAAIATKYWPVHAMNGLVYIAHHAACT